MAQGGGSFGERVVSYAARGRGIGWRRVTAALIAALAVAAVAIATSVGTAGAQATGTRQVSGLLPGLSLATPISAAPSTQRLQIGVGISRPNAAGEQSLYNSLYDKSSPDYHHFLSVSQFKQEFGVKPATTAAVRSFLTGGGLSIDTSSTGGDYFTATGTVAQLDKLFDVKIGDYSYKGVRFEANNAAPQVPDNLPIDGVAGLESLSRYTLDSLTGKQLAKVKSEQAAIKAGRAYVEHHASRKAKTSITLPIADGDEQTYTPQDLWGVYDDPGAAALTESTGLSNVSTLENSNYSLGQGQTIGVFGEGETSSVVSQLRLFEDAMGFPKVPVRTIETEGAPDSAYGDNSGAIEWYLDSQSSTGMAPDVKQLDFYFAKSLDDTDVSKEFNYWANDPNGPREMNASFGECEENPTQPATGPLNSLPAGVGLGDAVEQLGDPALRQAAIEGRTLFTSAGDTGSGCPEVDAPVLGAGNGLVVQPVPFQNYPCISDYVVCVGGTVVSSPGTGYPDAAKRTAETSWTFSGGGSSYFNTAPSYQNGVSAIDIDCVSNDTGTTAYTPGSAPQCRGVPDVADLSGNTLEDAYFIYIDGEPSEEGGTSLSSPLMMGQWARIQAAAPAAVQNKGGVGFADPTIYQQAKGADNCTTAPCTDPTYERDFYDVTQSEFGAGNGAYRPQGGWDYASGWGALNVANFAQDVDGSDNATDSYSGAEQSAADVCLATMASPTGNATDPITDETLDSGVDLTQATLTSSAKTVTATLTVPGLSDGPPSESTDGAAFYVAWEYKGLVYFAQATESEAGADWTYSSGNTGAPITSGVPNFGSYTDTTSSAATGTANTSTGVITISIPSSEVGSPAAGALLTDPQAFVQIQVGAPEVISAESITVDSSDNLRAYSLDDGELDSIGVDVVFDGQSGSNCSNTLPVTSVKTSGGSGGGTTTSSSGGSSGSGSGASFLKTTTTPTGKVVACDSSKLPVTHITSHTLNRKQLKLKGTSVAHCPDYITKVSLAIARNVKKRCSFLTAKGKWTKLGGCAPKDYFAAKGTAKWSFSKKVKLTKGVYFLWEHAVDNRKYTTKNRAGKHVFFRIR
jgi:pseudomonalisin